MRRGGGFTLIELIVVLAVMGILAAAAAPSFTSIMLSQQIKSTSFDIVASLSYARSEAIKQNGNVTVTPTGGNWAAGWAVTGPDGATLRTEPAAGNLAITGPASIVYGRSGRVTSGSGDIVVDDNQGLAAVAARCITVDLTGIPRSKLGGC